MARIATLTMVLAALVWAGLALRSGRGSLSGSMRGLAAEAGSSGKRILAARRLRAADLLASLRVVFYFLALVSVSILAVTGFVPYWLWGPHASGFSLVLHVATGPVFAICMTGLTLLWAHRLRLDPGDLSRRVRGHEEHGGETGTAGGGGTPPSGDVAYPAATKALFWALVVLSPVVMGSIMLGMYPLFATPGQETLLTIHLIAGLLFVLVAILHVVRLVSSPTE